MSNEERQDAQDQKAGGRMALMVFGAVFVGILLLGWLV